MSSGDTGCGRSIHSGSAGSNRLLQYARGGRTPTGAPSSQAAPPPHSREKFLPRIGQRGVFHFAGDAPFELRPERGARPVNHDQIRRALDPNRVGHAGGITTAALLGPRCSSPSIKSRIVVRANRRAPRAGSFRPGLGQKTSRPIAPPRKGGAKSSPARSQRGAGTIRQAKSLRNAWRMNMKTFRGLREHPRGRPLLGPEPIRASVPSSRRTNSPKSRDAAGDESCARKFPRQESRLAQFLVGRDLLPGQLSGFDPNFSDLFGKSRTHRIIALRQGGLTLPEARPCQRPDLFWFIKIKLLA